MGDCQARFREKGEVRFLSTYSTHQEKEVSMAYSGCDTKYHNHQNVWADYPSDADYETKRKLQEMGYENFYIYYEPTNSYIQY